MKQYCVGVDIGGTTVKMGLFNIGGVIMEKWEIPTDKTDGGVNILRDVAASIKEHLSAKEIAFEDVTGVGMGVPGPVMDDGFVEVCVNLGWKRTYPAKELQALLGSEDLKVAVGNDANVAALGEQWMGGAKGYESSVMVTLGTGVGGGIVEHGKMISGSHGIGGEIGHITVNPDETRQCNCGNHGCLEQYASATGVVAVANKLLAENATGSSLRKYEKLTAKDVFDEAKMGDTLALQTVDILGKYLGLTLSYVTLTIDPEIFVIGGGVSKAGSILTDVIEKYYHKYVTISEKHATIALAQLGNDAGICGAARLVLE